MQVDISCVIHEVVSFLGSEDLLDYLSLFRKDSVLYKSICIGYHGVFRWPLLRAQCEPTPAGDHNIVVRMRKMPGELAHFPHIQELIFDAMIGTSHPQKVVGSCIHKALRELRATLLSGHFRSLKRLIVRNVLLHVDLETDLVAILREASLQSLEFVEMDMRKARATNDEGGFEYLPVIRQARLAQEVLAALSELPRLKDFIVLFCPSIDLSGMFMSQRWPSLTVLRSNYILREYSDSVCGLSDYWELGHVPSVTTLVVGEWSSTNGPPRFDLFWGLPKGCGMKQITKLVLTGRVLKNPLLNFRIPSLYTLQEMRSGAGGLIPAPLFHNVQILDISRLFVPAAFTRDEVAHLGFIAEHYDVYAASFRANTCRALENLTAALLLEDGSLPTLVISDAFYGADGLMRWADLAIGGAIVDCLEGLQPERLVVQKLELNREANEHCGQAVFLDSPQGEVTASLDDLDCGMRRCQHENGFGAGDPDKGFNLFQLLSTTKNLHACVLELEIDCEFLFSSVSILELIFKLPKSDDWLEECLEDLWGHEDDDGDEDAQELARDLFAESSFWQFHDKVMSLSDSARQAIIAALVHNTSSLCDFSAALRPYSALRKLVVNNERVSKWCPHSPDLEMLCNLPPPGCKSLEVRGVYGAAELNEFRERVWSPLLAGRRAKKLFEFFPPACPQTTWVQGSLELTATCHGGASWLTVELRRFYFSKHDASPPRGCML